MKFKKIMILFLLSIIMASSSSIALASFSVVRGDFAFVSGNDFCDIQFNQDCFQTWRAEKTGTLVNMSMEMFSIGTPAAVTEILIYNTTNANGIPEFLLANYTAVPSSFTSASPVWFNSSGSLEITEGKFYAVVLHSQNTAGNLHKNNEQIGTVYINGSAGFGNGNLAGFTIHNQEASFITWILIEDPPLPDEVNISLLHPLNNILTAEDPLVINYTTSALFPISNVSIFINGTLNKTIIGNANTTIDIGEGVYSLTIIATNNLSITGNDSISSFKIDRTNPFDDLITIVPSGTEIINDINWTITAQNTNLFGHNVTVRDSNGNILFSQEVLNISFPSHAITIPVDVSVYGTGTFTITSNESDDHTRNKIRDYQISNNIASKLLSFDTGDALINVQILDAKKILNNLNQVSIMNKLVSMGSNKKQDRYDFTYSFNPSIASVDHYLFTFSVQTNKEIYQRNTQYKGHIVIGNDHWLDFEGYNVQEVAVIQTSKDTYQFTIKTSSPELIFESIGGVNQGGSETTFIILPPSISSIQCESSSIFSDCSAIGLGKTVTAVRHTCLNGTSSTMSLFQDIVPLFTSNTTIKAGNTYTFNNDDVLLNGSSYSLNATCINEAGSSSLGQLFTPVLFISELQQESNLFIVLAATVGSSALIIAVIVLMIKGNIIPMFRRKK